jgi:DNA end-binding protein Ku
VIRDAMRQEKKAGIGRVVLSSREHAVVLSPRGRGLQLTTLRSPEEVRDDSAYFGEVDDDAELDPEMVELAAAIITKKSGRFDPKELAEDRYQQALLKLVQAKIKGQKPVIAKVSGPAPVINLMDALRRSLGQLGDEGKGPAASKRTQPAATRKSAPATSGDKGKPAAAKRRKAS